MKYLENNVINISVLRHKKIIALWEEFLMTNMDLQLKENMELKNEVNALKAQIAFMTSTMIYVPKVKTDFVKYLFDWIEIHKLTIKKNTYLNYMQHIVKHFEPYFQGYNLEDITVMDIEKYYSYKIEEGLSVSTIKKHRSTLSAAFSYALSHEMINKNPIPIAVMPKQTKYEAEILSFNEIRDLIQIASKDTISLPVLLASLLGLRASEALGLRWDRIDFTNHTITINHTYLKCWDIRRKKTVYWFSDTTKNKASKRILPMPVFLEKALKIHKLVQMNSHPKNKKYKDYVCTQPNGNMINHNILSKHMNNLIKEMNINKHITFHGLRHSFATYLYKDFHISIKDIQVFLGHSDISTTGNIYTHIEINPEISQLVNNRIEMR